jgi:16S rRNA (cytidine1402-2'-O)-methyltransferase
MSAEETSRPSTPDAEHGRLVLIGTPIGNLGDLSPRAAATFGAADVVACEDTRRTGRLLAHLGVRAPKLVRLDDHTELEVAPRLLASVGAGQLVAVASDAGMPALSDPGARVAAMAIDQGLRVEVVPGPFAAAVALVGSGLVDVSGRFCFEGFLPRKGAARRDRLEALRGERRTVVLYEAPHRLARTVADLASTLGDERRVALCRELTKLHEETWRGTLAEAGEHLAARAPRGEYVLVLDGAEDAVEVDDDRLVAELQHRIGTGATRRDASTAVAAQFGVAPNRVKRLSQRLDGDPSAD